MTLPGTTATSGGDSGASSLPTDISQVFVLGFSEKGPANIASRFRSLGQYSAVGGQRSGGSLLYDWVDTHFRCFGAGGYWGRVLGPNWALSEGTLAGASTSSLKVVATSPGAWGNALSYTITVVETTKRKVVVKLSGTVVQELTFATNEEAVAWASSSPYFRFKDLGGGLPKAATLNLAGGTDDRENATEAEWDAARALFTADLGPGKEVMPGHTTATAQEHSLSACEVQGRTARLDAIDGPPAEAITQATTLRAQPTARYGGLLWPWAVVKGIAPGTTRTVPYSAVDTGLSARNAALGLSPNDAAAGENGIAPDFVLGLSQPPLTEDEREELNDAGVSVAREMLGSVRTYGYRTLVNPVLDDTWLDLANADTDAYIKAKCKALGERFVFKTIDGKGQLASRFAAAIEGEILAPLYVANALFGNTPEEAYEVRVGADVNTEQTISEGKLRAKVFVQMSEDAEMIEIEITKEAV